MVAGSIRWGRRLFPLPSLQLEPLEGRFVPDEAIDHFEEFFWTYQDKTPSIPNWISAWSLYFVGASFQQGVIHEGFYLNPEEDPILEDLPNDAPELLRSVYSPETRAWLAGLNFYGHYSVVDQHYKMVNKALELFHGKDTK